MKRFVLFLFALALACEPAREASDMSSPYTPVTNNNPASLTLPSPGDLVAAAVVDQAFKDLADRSQYNIQFADIAGQTGAQPGTKVYVSQTSWYEYTPSTPFTADGFWVITATGMGSGQWINGLLGWVNLKKMASVGPAPGESFTAATPANKINKDLIVRGYFTHRLLPEGSKPLSFTTTSGTAVNFTNFGVSADEIDFGALAISDIVDMRVDATANGNSAAAFDYLAQMQYQENGGSWVDAHFNGQPYRADTNNSKQIVQLSFTHQIAVAGTFKVRCRVVSDGTHQTVVTVDSWYGLVTRP